MLRLGQALALVQPFQAAVQKPGFYFGQGEQVFNIFQRPFVVERPTRKDDDVNVISAGKGMDADVALGDYDEPGDA